MILGYTASLGPMAGTRDQGEEIGVTEIRDI